MIPSPTFAPVARNVIKIRHSSKAKMLRRMKDSADGCCSNCCRFRLLDTNDSAVIGASDKSVQGIFILKVKLTAPSKSCLSSLWKDFSIPL